MSHRIIALNARFEPDTIAMTVLWYHSRFSSMSSHIYPTSHHAYLHQWATTYLAISHHSSINESPHLHQWATTSLAISHDRLINEPPQLHQWANTSLSLSHLSSIQEKVEWFLNKNFGHMSCCSRLFWDLKSKILLWSVAFSPGAWQNKASKNP